MLPRSRGRFTPALLLLLFQLAPATAPAQGLAPQMPSMPLGVDLKKAPVGSWSQYTTLIPGMPPISVRMALVARSGNTTTIEATMEGGMMARAGKTVVQMVIQGDPTREESAKSQAVQVGSNEPMELPAKLSGMEKQGGFQKPNPKSLVGTETIKTPAGSIKAKHYRDKTGQSPVDFWLADEVNPLGLVKLETETPGGGGLPRGTMKMELTATGKDAKQVITRTPRAFDQALLINELVAGVSGTGGSSGKKDVTGTGGGTGKPGPGGAAGAKSPKK